jgi:hypothetical protein
MEEFEGKSDEEIVKELDRQAEEDFTRRRGQPFAPPDWQELSPGDLASLRWRRFRSAAAGALEAAVVLVICGFIGVLLFSLLTRDLHPIAVLIPSLGLGFVGFFFAKGVAANLRAMGRISEDLAEGRKQLADGYVTAAWVVDNSRRSRQRIFNTPWRRWATRYLVELKLAAGREPEEFEVPYDLYRQVARRDLVRAEITPHSRVLLRVEKRSG